MAAQKKQSVNEGDIMEGIFAIACALYLANGKIEKNKLNLIRTKIEPSRFINGPVNIKIKDREPIKLDFVSVDLQVRLKRSAHAAFGQDAGFYIEKQSDIGKIDQKINTLIRTSSSSSYLIRLKSVMDSYIRNNKSESIDFIVVADGMEGEKSGGEIKGDIMISLFVKRKGKNNLSLMRPETVSYSLKSGSKTASNLSVWNGGYKFIKHFSLPEKRILKYQTALEKRAETQKEKEYKDQASVGFFQEIALLLQSKRTSLTGDAIDYIQTHVMGADQSTLVEINTRSLKEISKEKFDEIRNKKLKIIAVYDGKNTIKFVSDKNKKEVLFQIRLKITPSKSRKFLVEIGNLLK